MILRDQIMLNNDKLGILVTADTQNPHFFGPRTTKPHFCLKFTFLGQKFGILDQSGIARFLKPKIAILAILGPQNNIF